MYVCICAAVTEAEIVEEIADGAHDCAELSERTLAGTGCGSCVPRLEGLLDANVPETCPLRALAGLARSA
jgi:bacterioferritin-associated ferredoxin